MAAGIAAAGSRAAASSRVAAGSRAGAAAPRRKIRFLIVGQGIAGTMLAWALMRRGCARNFLLVDAGLEYSSSLVSTAVLNPVVFKRMTLSWGSDLVVPAWNIYEELETFLRGYEGYGGYEGRNTFRFLHRKNLFHIFNDHAEENRWRAAVHRLHPWLREGHVLKAPLPAGGSAGERGAGGSAGERRAGGGSGERRGGIIYGSGWINAAVLLRSFRTYLSECGQLIEEHLHSEQLDISSGIWRCRQGDVLFDSLILCTGIQYRYTFGYSLPDSTLPFYPMKGDVLTVDLPELGYLSGLTGGKVILQPVFDTGGRVKGRFHAGSSYVRDFSDPAPSEEGRKWILSQLSEQGFGSFERLAAAVRGHRAGIRPASRDRLAYLGSVAADSAAASAPAPAAFGWAPFGRTAFGRNRQAGDGRQEEGRVCVFNGLGTRGFMLAPALAEKCADFLMSSQPLPEELSPDRVKNVV
ncbi:MAG: NAD(P)/FAD-dependent oxidoreductase [Salinispira sp.]